MCLNNQPQNWHGPGFCYNRSMQPLDAHGVKVGQTFVQVCARSQSTTIPTTIEGIEVEEPIAKSKAKFE